MKETLLMPRVQGKTLINHIIAMDKTSLKCRWTALDKLKAFISCKPLIITFENEDAVQKVLQSQICPCCEREIDLIRRRSE